MCGSLLADLFPPESRGLANGIFSWGVYWGYGFAFLLGIQVNNKAILISALTLSTQGTQLDMLGYGWRGPYLLAALPGILTAGLIILTLKEPERQATAATINSSNDEERECASKCASTLRLLASPALLLLLLAAMAR